MTTSNSLAPQAIKSLIANNRLDEALSQMMKGAQQLGLTALYNQLVIQSGKLKQHQQENRQGSVDYADLTRTRVNIGKLIFTLFKKDRE